MERYINVIANSIKDERCVLMIGPDMCLNKDGIPLHQALQEYIQEKTDIEVEIDIDNLLVFKTKSGKTFFYSDLKKFYTQNKEPQDLQRKIAQIPFNLIISASPDLMLKEAHEELGMKYDFQFYNKKENPKDVKKPTGERPLLYNFFGSMEEEDSLIITSDDLFEFLFSILGGEQRLPRELKNMIRSARIFVFLGFDFKAWYLKLILRLFDIHKDTLPFANSGKLEDSKLKSFYIQNFEMEFINLEIEEFVNQLYENFKSESKLKEISTATENPVAEKIKNLIKEDETEQALEGLEEYLDNQNTPLAEELLNAVIQQSGMYNRLQRQIKKGVMSQENITLELNQINDSILQIVSELKNF